MTQPLPYTTHSKDITVLSMFLFGCRAKGLHSVSSPVDSLVRTSARRSRGPSAGVAAAVGVTQRQQRLSAARRHCLTQSTTTIATITTATIATATTCTTVTDIPLLLSLLLFIVTATTTSDIKTI